MKPKNEPVSYVIGPQGTILTTADLPPAAAGRWTDRRKAEIVIALRGGLLTLEEASDRYALTVEELATWQRLI
jgi:carotenoid cleavage dioxygenase-like enzyme